MDVIMMLIAAISVIVALPGAIVELIEILRALQRRPNGDTSTDCTASQQ